jgi:hypothetical protein
MGGRLRRWCEPDHFPDLLKFVFISENTGLNGGVERHCGIRPNVVHFQDAAQQENPFPRIHPGTQAFDRGRPAPA